MNDRIDRAKKFAKKYRFSLVYSAGVVMGGTLVYYVMSNGKTLELVVSPDNLQKLIDKPGGALQWVEKNRPIVYLFNEKNPNL